MKERRLSAFGTKQTYSMRSRMSVLGAKQPVTNRCLPISVYEYQALTDAAPRRERD